MHNNILILLFWYYVIILYTEKRECDARAYKCCERAFSEGRGVDDVTSCMCIYMNIIYIISLYKYEWQT